MLKLLVPILRGIAWHVRHIPDRWNPGTDLLIRHYLIGRQNHRWGVLCLHRLMRSDPATLHDHPACYAVLVLTGGYWEHTPTGPHWRGPGHFRFRSGRSLHRIEIDEAKGEVWTLFFMGPRTRNWGFMTPGGWVRHEKYLGEI